MHPRVLKLLLDHDHPSTTSDAKGLIQSFQNTDYIVQLDDPVKAKVGQFCPSLDELSGPAGWAILTAWNPRATIQNATQNRHADQALVDDLLKIRTGAMVKTIHRARQVEGQSDWPDEQGWLFSIGNIDHVHSLAERYDQLGSLIGQPGQVTKLWLYGDQWPSSPPDHVQRWPA